MARTTLIALVLVSLALQQVVYAYPPAEVQPSGGNSADAIRRCNAPSAIEESMKCWMDSKDGNWLTGPEVLDAQKPLKEANWNEFVETAFRKERNITKALNRVFQASGGISSVGLGFALQADDAIYGENAVATRGKICGALNSLVDCLSKHAARCQDAVNERIDRLPMTLGMSSDFRLPPTAKFDSVMVLGSKLFCYLCNEKNEHEGLKVALATALDGTKRKQLTDAMKPANRLNSYQQCPVDNVNMPNPPPETNEQFMRLLQTQPCAFQPYFHCLAEDVQRRVNQGVQFNVLDGVGNLTFNHMFGCNNLQVPDYGACKQADATKSNFQNYVSARSSSAASDMNNDSDLHDNVHASGSPSLLSSGLMSVFYMVAVAVYAGRMMLMTI